MFIHFEVAVHHLVEKGLLIGDAKVRHVALLHIREPLLHLLAEITGGQLLEGQLSILVLECRTPSIALLAFIAKFHYRFIKL